MVDGSASSKAVGQDRGGDIACTGDIIDGIFMGDGLFGSYAGLMVVHADTVFAHGNTCIIGGGFFIEMLVECADMCVFG